MADSPHHTDKHSALSSPEDIPNVRPVMVDTRPEILVLSSAIRDGLNQAMQPVNTTLEALSRTVITLQHKLHPPSHYGLGSEASTSIDVATPPSAFWQPVRQLPSMSRAPPSPFAELGVHTAPPSHASAGLGAAPLPPPPCRSGHGRIGPQHSLQPPSFFRVGTTTEVDLEVIDPVLGVGDDSLSIHASNVEDGHLISEADGGESTSQFVASQFAAFSQDIALPVEDKAPTLPPDMAECFKSSFHLNV